jgi:hypothetical protein
LDNVQKRTINICTSVPSSQILENKCLIIQFPVSFVCILCKDNLNEPGCTASVVKLLMDDQLERIWEEAIIPGEVIAVKLKYYPRIFLRGLRKTKSNLCQGSRCACGDLNWIPLE